MTPEQLTDLVGKRKSRRRFVENNGCWDWTEKVACFCKHPHCSYCTTGGPSRDVWKAVHGKAVPSGKNVCHTCDRGRCGRPSHLWLGTQKQNMRDKNKKGRDWMTHWTRWRT